MPLQITFPFDIVQSSDRSVEIIPHLGGEPLIRMEIHPQISRTLTDEQADRVYTAALREAVMHSMTIQEEIPRKS